jgi:DNA repair exonuclease SbcCD ATPase subunit
MSGRGSKRHHTEIFDVIITDNQDGTEQELSTLSGGESVWIKRALYDAFGIIRDRNTGTRFLTCFADEADGALDPEAKAKYIQMLQQAHQESGRRHTIVITHSPECQEMIGQKILMAELAEPR